jgi:hypothetical protein
LELSDMFIRYSVSSGFVYGRGRVGVCSWACGGGFVCNTRYFYIDFIIQLKFQFFLKENIKYKSICFSKLFNILVS